MRLNQFIHNTNVTLQLISAQHANAQVNLSYTLVRMCKSPFSVTWTPINLTNSQ